MTDRDLAAEKLEAQLRETDARLDALHAHAEAREAKEEMAEISGLREAKERVRVQVADLKRDVSEDFEVSKRAVKSAIDDLEVRIQRATERFAGWDEARERRLHAKLDEAEATLRAWKAQLDQKRADARMEVRHAIARLEEKTALARARSAELSHDRHNRKAQEALEEAARHFDEAYEAAKKHQT